MAGESYILMGVSGSGKSLIGSKIATLFSAKFIDGDDLHPAKNIDKMSQGIPLTDEDRLPWLDGDYATILQRMQRRAGHFMPPDLLQSQFDALERPCADEHDIARIDVNHDIEHVTEQCRQAVQAFRQALSAS
ncbi:gluconate kinase [Salmonella enterica]|nr:gluconate kinase [Salmonella enterica]